MNEFITTHKELLKLHGEKITCNIIGVDIKDAKICVGRQGFGADIDNLVCVCHNNEEVVGVAHPEKSFGYKNAFWISQECDKYEDDGQGCSSIKLAKDCETKSIPDSDEGIPEPEKMELPTEIKGFFEMCSDMCENEKLPRAMQDAENLVEKFTDAMEELHQFGLTLPAYKLVKLTKEVKGLIK